MDDARNGSDLCVACGLCCKGMFHEQARAFPEEVPWLETKGFTVSADPQGLTFSLPCSYLGATGCSLYQERPKTCRTYQCRLLIRYLEGEVSLEQALETVEQVHELRSQILRKLEVENPTRNLWQLIRSHEPENLEPETSLDIASLLHLSARHFDARGKDVKVLTP
jgi:Fe-S-cluster containining protein